MILDSKGNPVSSKSPKPTPKRRNGSCPDCGADKDHMKPSLGGFMNCMKCGRQIKEAQRV